MKNRVIGSIALALVLMLVCGAALAEVVTTANVWMRTGPGLKYDQVTSLSEGKKLTYLGETSVDERGVAWYKVTYGKHTGWVSSKYTKLKGEKGTVVNTPQPTAEPTAAPTATPAPTATLPALEVGQLFVDIVNGEEEAAPSDRAPGAQVELSAYYLENLVTAANEIGLVSYREVQSEAPYQYYDTALIIAGNQLVENIVIYGEGYELYGARVGMALNEAVACLTAAGLDSVNVPVENGATFQHKGTEMSRFVDDDGHDSCINLKTDENGVVTIIDWSSYTG